MLQNAEYFPKIYTEFIRFLGDTDVVFCLWGMSDLKELFKNAESHNLNTKNLSRRYINIQPFVSLYFNYSVKNLLKLEYSPFMLPQTYDPMEKIKRTPGKPKKIIDTDGLIRQFEKMYARKMSEEEQSIILLAYKMGKTGQFLK